MVPFNPAISPWSVPIWLFFSAWGGMTTRILKPGFLADLAVQIIYLALKLPFLFLRQVRIGQLIIQLVDPLIQSADLPCQGFHFPLERADLAVFLLNLGLQPAVFLPQGRQIRPGQMQNLFHRRDASPSA